MADLTPAALAALLKSKIGTVDFTSGELENDALLLAMSEALVVAFSDNTIFANPIQNGGVAGGSILSIANIATLAWNPAPSGTYSSESGLSQVSSIRFVVDTTGGWLVTGVGETVDEVFGRWRPNLDEDTTSYEISINASGSPAFPTGGIPLDGTWTTLSTNMGAILSDPFGGGASVTNISVEIRQRGIPSNTTGVATFSLRSLQEGTP